MSRTTIHDDAAEAVAGITDGATILVGGFGMAGMPTTLIDALIAQGATGLTIVSNNAGYGDTGLAALLAAGRVDKVICCFPRQSDSHVFDGLYRAGQVRLEVVPQGNLAERIRAAGAGIGAFFCPTGVGTPTTVADFLDPAAGVVLHTENGMLGMGSEAFGDDVDTDLTNAGKIPVTETPEASYFHHADSFAMMRGGQLDVCVLGAFQVSHFGDLANWHTGAPDAVGGAMDLAIGAKNVFVMMNLFTKDGSAKLVADCTYPLTGLRCVSRVYTDHAVFHLDPTGGAAVEIIESFGITFVSLAARLSIELL